MSTIGKRSYRPAIHFSPEQMWMNDPNGMVYIDGTYHFFYQYYPEESKWGPMHWGHAISEDLIHWEHQPVALYPDELGFIFSGSCVYDKDNCSGYGRDGKMPMIALFTSHGEKDGLEQQSIAYSLDGVHFEKSYLNPVIPNPGMKDFRDPKGFYNPVKNCYSLVLAAGDKVLFYDSHDLKKWEKSGEFKPEGNCAIGICECPDCFPVQTWEGEKWVMIISMITEVSDKRKNLHRTLYFVGDFDGDRFIPDSSFQDPVWLDGGIDNYAAVTFQNHDTPVIMGWAASWGYADKMPTGVYCGQATLAREIALNKTKEGWRIAQKPLGLEKMQEKCVLLEKETVLETESFGLKISGKGIGTLTFTNRAGQKLVVELGESEITADRTLADDKSFHEVYAMKESSVAKVKRSQTDDLMMDLIFDVSVMEIFAGKGMDVISMCVFPDEPYDALKVEGDFAVKMYQLV